MKPTLAALFVCFLFQACFSETTDSFWTNLSYKQSIESNNTLEEGYVCGSNGFYIAGDQKGTFEPKGWHINGEMSGVWMQPIKLLNSFSYSASAYQSSSMITSTTTAPAKKFTQYQWGNMFEYYSEKAKGKFHIKSVQYVPEEVPGAIIEFFVDYYTVVSNRIPVADNVVLSFTGLVNLMPCWMSNEFFKTQNGEDNCWWDTHNQAIVCVDKLNDWFVIIGAVEIATAYDIAHPNEIPASEYLQSDVFRLYHPRPQLPNAKVPQVTLHCLLKKLSKTQFTGSIIVTGSHTSLQEAIHRLTLLRRNKDFYFEATAEKYSKIANKAKIEIPDKSIQQMYEWNKYNIEWLTMSKGDMKAFYGGLPEYPMLFGCDTTYTVEGLLAIGNFDLAMSSLALLSDISLRHNHNGQIIHEVTANGAVYNPGNIQETAHFIIQLGNVYNYTGKIEYILSQYEALQRGAQFLKDKDTDGNYIPEGRGIMEIEGLENRLEMIDVAVYTGRAYQTTSYLLQELIKYKSSKEFECSLALEKKNQCSRLSNSEKIDCVFSSKETCESNRCCWTPTDTAGVPFCYFPDWRVCELDVSFLQEKSIYYANAAREIRKFVNTAGWVEYFKTFADFFATPLDAVTVIQSSIDRLNKLQGTKLMLLELESMLKDTNQKISQNSKYANTKKGWVVFNNWICSVPMEMNFIDSLDLGFTALGTTRVYSNEFGRLVTGVDKFTKKSSQNSVGLYAQAVMTLPTGVQAVAEGNYAKSCNTVLEQLTKLANSFSYATPGSLHEISPKGGCYVQAWNLYSVAVPLITNIFGIFPNAPQRKITIAPQFPTNWSSLEITDYNVGSNSVSLECQINFKTGVECHIFSEEKNWEIEFVWFSYYQYMIRGKNWLYKLNEQTVIPISTIFNNKPAEIVSYHTTEQNFYKKVSFVTPINKDEL